MRLSSSFKWITGLAFFSITLTVHAEEGMWLLSQIDQLHLNEKGLEIPVTEIYNPDGTALCDAIAWLGGCSSSFISPDGLLITNHHCAYGSLMRASTPENNYLENGFVAMSREKEIEAPGARAYILLKTQNVTSEVLASVVGIEDLVKRQNAIDARIEAMTDSIETGHEDYYATIRALYEGRDYLLYVYQKFDDVRLVVAPPKSIGKYGGDIDNWMWPRHTGDFTVYRVYTAPNGSGASYSLENVPYRPKKWLKVSTGNLNPGDFTFIMGFPGRTYRYRTAVSVDYSLNYYYPYSIANYREEIELIEKVTANSPEGTLKAQSTLAGINNVMKKYQGLVDGMTRTGFLKHKLSQEADFQRFIDAYPAMRKAYGNVLSKIKTAYDSQITGRTREEILNRLSGSQSGFLFSVARRVYTIAKELEKPLSERQPGYTKKDIEEAAKRLKYSYFSYYEPTDKALLKLSLQKATALPDSARITGLDPIVHNTTRSIDEFVETLFQNTRFADGEYVAGLFGKSVKELTALNDPMINFSADLYHEFEAKRLENEQFYANLTDLRKRYIEALLLWKNGAVYPDASGTLRFTYGTIQGYSPHDAVEYLPFTSLGGVVEKATGEAPFDMPDRLGELYNDRNFGRWADPELGDVPACFTHECDITGGNSGSAVMNARGELIGLAFDGNYEAMTGDWEYDATIQRTISVDIRFVMFLIEKYAGAGYLLDEMTLTGN